MPKGKNKKIYAVIFWILTALCMAVIFWLSSRTADESSAQSNVIVELLKKLFGDNIFTDFIVRKSAHCLEFTGLSLLFNISLFITKEKPLYFYAVLFTSLYAATDEIHQLFVEGRSCQISDWAIDTAGALLGALAFSIIFCIFKSFSKKKNYVDRGNN